MISTSGSGPQGLSVAGHQHGSWHVLDIGGELDLATAPELDERIDGTIESLVRPLIALELNRLDFCDSSGLNSLVRAQQRIGALDGRLILLNPQRQLRGALRMTGLVNRFTISDSVPA